MYGHYSPIQSSYWFSVSDCLDLLRPVADLLPADAVVQAELEEFGIEFRYGQVLTGRQQLLAIGADIVWVDQTIDTMRRYLRGILPWTPGPPRPDGNQLSGNLQSTTLTVAVHPPVLDQAPVLDDDISDDYYPERLRRAIGRL